MKKLLNLALVTAILFLGWGCKPQEATNVEDAPKAMTAAFAEGETPASHAHLNPHLVAKEDYPENHRAVKVTAFEKYADDLYQLDQKIREVLQQMEGNPSGKVNRQLTALTMLDYHLLPNEAANPEQVNFYLDLLLKARNPSWEVQLQAIQWLKARGDDGYPAKAQTLEQNMANFRTSVQAKLDAAENGDAQMLAWKDGLEKSMARMDACSIALAAL